MARLRFQQHCLECTKLMTVEIDLELPVDEVLRKRCEHCASPYTRNVLDRALIILSLEPPPPPE